MARQLARAAGLASPACACLMSRADSGCGSTRPSPSPWNSAPPFIPRRSPQRRVAFALATVPDAGALLTGVLDGTLLCAYGRLAGGRPRSAASDGAADADALLLADPSGRPTLFTDPPGGTRSDTACVRCDRSCAASSLIRRSAVAAAVSLDRPDALYRLLLCADTVGGFATGARPHGGYTSQRQAFAAPSPDSKQYSTVLVDHAVRSRGMSLLLAEAARSIGDEDGAERATSRWPR